MYSINFKYWLEFHFRSSTKIVKAQYMFLKVLSLVQYELKFDQPNAVQARQE